MALEADVENLSRFIDFDPANYSAFSIEMAHLMLAAASEVDVVAKLVCKKIIAKSKAENITQYRSIIKKAFPQFCQMKVLMPRYELTLEPWKNWRSNRTPNWWNYYNRVKHERDKYFNQANLENTLNAITGLYVTLLHFYLEEANTGMLIPSPRLFRIEKQYDGGIDISGGDLKIHYRLYGPVT
jgi:hypothetical protein